MSFRVGVVGRPHGLDGSFHVMSPRSELLSEGVVLEDLGPIVGRKGSDDRPIIRVEGVADREAALALGGRELVVDEANRPPLEEDEYLAQDLIGSRVVDGDHAFGEVVRLLAMPSCEVLELDDGTLIPMVKDAIRTIDVDARRIEIDREFLGLAT